jgi:epoxyqueuosine reductase
MPVSVSASLTFMQNEAMAGLGNIQWIIAQARELGFDLCGIARASDLIDPNHWQEWLSKGYAGEMRYLRDPRRADPAQVLPGVQSMIVCALNYNTRGPYSTEARAEAALSGEARAWISRYAWGQDYHHVVKERLERLIAAIRERLGSDFEARAYVDTGPVAERLAAQSAGLGWLAKNTCLINENLGSWLFLGVILTSFDLAAAAQVANTPPADLCGSCRLCLDACPTGALVEPYVLDARRCISYLTIELRGSIPEELRPAIGWQVFGCDICQDVCPWNRTAPGTAPAAFLPRQELFAPAVAWLLSLGEEEFRQSFRHSALWRAKWRGLLRNACIAAGNAGATVSEPDRALLRRPLAELAACDDAILAEHAHWALSRLERTAK